MRNDDLCLLKPVMVNRIEEIKLPFFMPLNRYFEITSYKIHFFYRFSGK
jgi:hypothetical protein